MQALRDAVEAGRGCAMASGEAELRRIMRACVGERKEGGKWSTGFLAVARISGDAQLAKGCSEGVVRRRPELEQSSNGGDEARVLRGEKRRRPGRADQGVRGRCYL